jgi:hypothetical protein
MSVPPNGPDRPGRPQAGDPGPEGPRPEDVRPDGMRPGGPRPEGSRPDGFGSPGSTLESVGSPGSTPEGIGYPSSPPLASAPLTSAPLASLPRGSHAHRARALWGVVVLVPLLVGLALAAFAWPAARLAPRDVPVGVVAPAAAGTAIEQRLARDGDAVEVHRFADRAAAEAAIADRDVYGAIVIAPEGATVLTASAASPPVAQLLQQAATGAAPAQADAAASSRGPAASSSGATAPSPGPAATSPGAAPSSPVRVVDVVPADPDDPRGAALAASVLPLVLAGMAAGLLVWLAGGGWPARWAALVGASALAGLVAAGTAQGWLGVLGGSWAVNAAVLGLTVLAVGATVAGLAALGGRAGAALGALLMVLVGNPLSGVSSAPELLPAPAGAIGQLLPPGAGGTLLRSTAFFDGAGATAPLAVLAAWVLLGLALTWVVALRRPRPSPVGAPEGDPVAVS